MRWLFHPLLLLLANSTEGELAKQVEFLKAENAMLRRRLPKWVQTTAEERSLLVKLGEAVGPGVQRLLTIVQYTCYRRWVTKANGTYGKAPVLWSLLPAVIGCRGTDPSSSRLATSSNGSE